MRSYEKRNPVALNEDRGSETILNSIPKGSFHFRPRFAQNRVFLRAKRHSCSDPPPPPLPPPTPTSLPASVLVPEVCTLCVLRSQLVPKLPGCGNFLSSGRTVSWGSRDRQRLDRLPGVRIVMYGNPPQPSWCGARLCSAVCLQGPFGPCGVGGSGFQAGGSSVLRGFLAKWLVGSAVRFLCFMSAR